MSKLRHHNGDPLTGIVQWLGRKIRHHDPLSETVGAKVRGVYNSRKRVAIDVNKPTHVIYSLEDGRRYELTVREMDATEKVELVAVGQ